MDGFEFLSIVQRNEKWAEIPVIVVTAKTLTEDDYRRLHGNINTIISKSEESLDVLLSQLSDQIRLSISHTG